MKRFFLLHHRFIFFRSPFKSGALLTHISLIAQMSLCACRLSVRGYAEEKKSKEKKNVQGVFAFLLFGEISFTTRLDSLAHLECCLLVYCRVSFFLCHRTGFFFFGVFRWHWIHHFSLLVVSKENLVSLHHTFDNSSLFRLLLFITKLIKHNFHFQFRHISRGRRL